jgi:hypothetical protein
VYFSSIQNDRWGCVASSSGSFITVHDNGYGVTPDLFKHMFALAVMAQLSEKPVAFDSAGTSPCSNFNSAWIVSH